MLSDMVPPPLRAVLANDDGSDNSREYEDDVELSPRTRPSPLLPLIMELVPSSAIVELSSRIPRTEEVREFVPSYVPSS